MKDFGQMTDEQLAVLAATGDEEAMESLYASCRNMIRSKANLYFMMGAERDDVIQEGMIGLFTAIRNYDADAGASFRTFAELCVKRQIINAVKMAGRKKHTPLNESVPIDGSMDDGDGGVVKPVFQAAHGTDPEDIVLLADLLDYVCTDAPQMFSLMENKVWDAFLEGRGIPQIAAEFGKSTKSVENTLQRIKKKVEKLMALY
jgi:RNA polymerase sporulation-specific sigma factor